MESGESYREARLRLGCSATDEYDDDDGDDKINCLIQWFICRSDIVRSLWGSWHNCRGTQTVGPSLLQGQMAAQSHPRNISDHRVPGTLTIYIFLMQHFILFF